MADDLRMSDYIERNFPVTLFLCRCSQWDGVAESDVTNWLANFVDERGKYYAVRILKHLVYYSENDLEKLLRRGIFDLILSREVLRDRLIPSAFSIIYTAAAAEVLRRVERTLFVPLLARPGPDESGLQVARMLTQRLGLPQQNVVFPWNLASLNYRSYDRVIICDDCLGTGRQIQDFWLQAQEGSPDLALRQICAKAGWQSYYLCLVGYANRIQQIATELTSLRLVAAEELTDKNRVFNQGSNFWDTEEERLAASLYFQNLEQSRGVPQYGFQGLDFGVILHRTVPDWTVPMLWHPSPAWKILLPRKDSHV